MPTFRFDHWDVNGTQYSPNPLSITITDTTIITAIYQEIIPRQGCFIATAAYGTPLSLELNVLRDFRDTFMRKTMFGHGIIEIYYNLSPPLALKLAKHQRLRWIVRNLLNPIVSYLRKHKKFDRSKLTCDPSEWEDMVE